MRRRPLKTPPVIVEAIRQLHLVRAGAIKSRTAAMLQISALIVTAPADIRAGLTAKTLKGKVSQCVQWNPEGPLADPVQATKFALHGLAMRIQHLNTEIADLTKRLSILVTQAAPRTMAQYGVGVIGAAQMLITAGSGSGPRHSSTRPRRSAVTTPSSISGRSATPSPSTRPSAGRGSPPASMS